MLVVAPNLWKLCKWVNKRLRPDLDRSFHLLSYAATHNVTYLKSNRLRVVLL